MTELAIFKQYLTNETFCDAMICLADSTVIVKCYNADELYKYLSVNKKVLFFLGLFERLNNPKINEFVSEFRRRCSEFKETDSNVDELSKLFSKFIIDFYISIKETDLRILSVKFLKSMNVGSRQELMLKLIAHEIITKNNPYVLKSLLKEEKETLEGFNEYYQLIKEYTKKKSELEVSASSSDKIIVTDDSSVGEKRLGFYLYLINKGRLNVLLASKTNDKLGFDEETFFIICQKAFDDPDKKLPKLLKDGSITIPKGLGSLRNHHQHNNFVGMNDFFIKYALTAYLSISNDNVPVVPRNESIPDITEFSLTIYRSYLFI